ncbi:MAG: TetR/AcrR family transcriptional regulator C-terminal domain-containing protein [Actinoallomurus sp.]
MPSPSSSLRRRAYSIAGSERSTPRTLRTTRAASLRDTGLTEGEKVSTVMLLSNYVRGTEAMFQSVTEAIDAAGTSPDRMMYSYSNVLRKLITASDFPSVATALEQGVFDQADTADGEFEFGLDRILDGLDVLVRART